jgi:hypothetical protein
MEIWEPKPPGNLWPHLKRKALKCILFYNILIQFVNFIQSHITLKLFAPQTPYSEFCRRPDDGHLAETYCQGKNKNKNM